MARHRHTRPFAGALPALPRACLAFLLFIGIEGCASRKAAALPQPEPQPYVRVARSADGTVALEVATRRLTPNHTGRPVLWMVAVTHLGTPEYFGALQRFLDAQDLVLFEGVGATNRHFQLRESSEFSLQSELAKAIGLEFQLEAIDYDRPHFRNSDLSVPQLERVFADRSRGGSRAGGGAEAGGGRAEFGALIDLMQGNGFAGGIVRLGLSVIRSSARLQAATRLAFIELLGGLPADLTRLPGLAPGLQSLMRVIVEERNRTVVADVRAAVRSRRPPRSVAVFYGAGHMADLERRLCAEAGYRPVEDRWLTAFDVNPTTSGLSEMEMDFTRRLVRAQLDALTQGKRP